MLSRPAAGLACSCPVSSCVLLSFPLWPGPVGLQGPSWAFPGPPLGPSWTSPGLLSGAILGFLAALGAPGPLLGLPWAAPDPSWGALGALLGCSWRLLGLSCWAPLLGTLEPSFGPLVLSGLGWALGWLLGRPKWSWVALGPS